ncbi:hypothetical protein D3C85_728230 [compost metagenome]
MHELVEQLAKSIAAKEPLATTGGWKLHLAGTNDSYRVKDGERYNIKGPLEYARRQSGDGTLIAVPVPKTFQQAKERADQLGDLIRCEPNIDSLLAACQSGDSLYVLMPSKLWPDFQESKLAAAIYDANTNFTSLLKGYMGELGGTPVWSELYEAPSAQVLDGDLWIIRRHEAPKKSYIIDDKNPPEPNEMVAYWERDVEGHAPGWASVDAQGESTIFVGDGVEQFYETERAEYYLIDDYTRIAIAAPRTVVEAMRYSVVRGLKTYRPSMLKFCHECNRPNTHYVIIGGDLWSKIMTNRRIVGDPEFKVSTEYERTLNGFLGTYKGTEVWSDVFLPSDERFCNNKLMVCREGEDEV